MKKVADFIRSYELMYRNWNYDALVAWLQWYADHFLLFKAIDLDGSIAGVLLIRTVMRTDEIQQPFFADPEGKIAYIELAICKKPNVTRALTAAALKRFGERQYVAWKRPPYFVTKVCDRKRFLKMVLRSNVYVH